MPNNLKLISGRVAVTPAANVTADRYQYLNLSSAEPNLGTGNTGDVLIYNNAYPGGRQWVPQADIRGSIGEAAYVQANTASANTLYLSGVDLTQNNRLTAVETNAQAAFDAANTKLSTSGGSITGSLNVSQNLTVTGNLTVLGTTTTINTSSFTVSDPLIQLAIGNYTSDLLDIGISGHYNDGTNAHTGLIRDHGTKDWYLFKGYTPELSGNNNIDINHASFAKANINADYFKGNVITGQNISFTSANTGIQSSTYTYNDPGYSWSFANNDQRLIISNGSSLSPGSSDFTIECFVNLSSFSSSKTIFRKGPSSGGEIGLTLDSEGSSFRISLMYAENVYQSDLISRNSVINQFGHIATTKSGTQAKFWFNGSQVGSATVPSSASNFTNTTYIGYVGPTVYQPLGYEGPNILSNLRVVIGSALYSSTFTPPTTKLSVISGTKLLIAQSNSYTDASGFNTITDNGSFGVTYSTVVPFTGSYTGANWFLEGTSGWKTTGTINVQNSTASTSNITGALKVAGGVGVLGNVSTSGIIFDDGTRQTTAATGIDSYARTTANSASSNTVIIQGVDTAQNTRMSIIEGVDTAQNTRMSIIEGVDTTQNTRMSIIEGVDTTQNTNITIIQGVDTWQNTQITSINSLAQGAFNRANSGARATTSNTAPTGNTVGDLWLSLTDETLYMYSYDGVSNNWIDISGPILISTNIVVQYTITANVS